MNHSRFFLLVLMMTTCCWMLSCGQSDAGTQESAGNTASPDSLTSATSTPPPDTAQAQFALWMAGLDSTDTTSAYRNYSKTTGSVWSRVLSRKIQPILNFRDSFLPELTLHRLVFYPFAGGDFLYPNAFFSSADTLMLVGLEPPGTLFSPDTLSPASRLQYLSGLSQSLFFSNELGFFRTLSMEKELKQSRLNGTLHPILFYLSRSGYALHSIRYAGFSPDGNWVDCSDSACHQVNIIRYYKNHPDSLHTLIYVSQDMSDEGLKKNPAFLKSLSSLHQPAVFLKAASYLMHQAEFASIRSWILQNSSCLLQDDSGIPLKFLKPEFSDIQVFGEYSRTIPLFAVFFQPELKQLFQDSSRVRNPGFIIGYNQKFQQTNLIFAKKMRTL